MACKGDEQPTSSEAGAAPATARSLEDTVYKISVVNSDWYLLV